MKYELFIGSINHVWMLMSLPQPDEEEEGECLAVEVTDTRLRNQYRDMYYIHRDDETLENGSTVSTLPKKPTWRNSRTKKTLNSMRWTLSTPKEWPTSLTSR